MDRELDLSHLHSNINPEDILKDEDMDAIRDKLKNSNDKLKLEYHPGVKDLTPEHAIRKAIDKTDIDSFSSDQAYVTDIIYKTLIYSGKLDPAELDDDTVNLRDIEDGTHDKIRRQRARKEKESLEVEDSNMPNSEQRKSYLPEEANTGFTPKISNQNVVKESLSGL